MTVAERRASNGPRGQFPIGMRVLAVDDDPICLKVLESMLLRCQYHVTATNEAIKALEMLRENKDQFDLVISDVHMPDMDGFKLLELVGLEMDLPVIMLSANDETEAVMKGITHGACDYLLKPVRLEELKNIWQHVVRRKKFDIGDQNNLDSGEDCDKQQFANFEGEQVVLVSSSSDQKLNRKRKDQDEENEEDEDDDDDNMHENEDQSTQKKPRVVWSVDLHRKFVVAVNQLGIDRAVPKRILDLMNVEGLTRENVASHLQKYRLYLKRLSAAGNQQVNMVSALRGRGSSYIPMGSLDGCANFNSLIGSRTLQGPRLNSFDGFGLHGFVPSGTSQLGCDLNNTNNSTNDVGKLQGIGLPTVLGNQRGTFFKGMPQPMTMQEANKSLLGSFSSGGLAIGHSSNSFTNAARPHHMLNNQQQTQSGALSNQSSVRIQPPLSLSDPFELDTTASSHSSDLGRCNKTWHGTVSPSTYRESTMSLPFDNNIRSNLSPMVSSLINYDRLGNLQNQGSSLLTTRANGDSNLFNVINSGNSNLKWDNPARGHEQNANPLYNSSSNSSVSNIHITDQNAGNLKLGNGFSNKELDMPITSQTGFGFPLAAQDSRIVSQLNYNEDHLFEGAKLPGGISSGGFGIDDLVANDMVKPVSDDFSFMDDDDDMGCNDLFSLGACLRK